MRHLDGRIFLLCIGQVDVDIALTCSVWMGNDYERNQRERLCVGRGFRRDWVAAVTALKPDAESVLTSEERSLQRLTLAVLETRGNGAGVLFDDLAHAMGPRPSIAVLMIIGHYVTHGLIVNTLGLRPPVPSILEDGFEG